MALEDAAADVTRALSQRATTVAWGGCDHLGPDVEVDVRAGVSTCRPDDEETPVLGWRLVALTA